MILQFGFQGFYRKSVHVETTCRWNSYQGKDPRVTTLCVQ